MKTYDYIVIGAGSAGCVMATRLASKHRVLLLEAGRADAAWDFRVHMPAALSEVLKGTWYNWAYNTLPEPHLNERVMYCPRAAVAALLMLVDRLRLRCGDGDDDETTAKRSAQHTKGLRLAARRLIAAYAWT